MATKLESDNPSSPTNEQSDGEEQDSIASNIEEEEEEDDDEQKPINSNVANILKRLQSTGALIKKPKQEYLCRTCDEDFPDWEELENHLIQHVSLPSVVLDKLPSDDEYSPPPSDWSDEEDPPVPKTTPQKIDISQILKKPGLTLKKAINDNENKDSNSALSKLSGLGFTIKKNSTPIKSEPETDTNNDLMSKLGKLGGIKLKLKSEGVNSNSFKVVNGLKDFKASDDEGGSGNDDSKEDEELFKGDQEGSALGEEDSADEDNTNENQKNTDSDEYGNADTNKTVNSFMNLQNTGIKIEPVKVSAMSSAIKQPVSIKPPSRPAIKQTPKRGVVLPSSPRESPQQQQLNTESAPYKTSANPWETNTSNMDNVVVKQEVDSVGPTPPAVPLFSSQIKSERTSPPPQQSDNISTPVIATVKSEPVANISTSETVAPSNTTPLLPITKTEDNSMTIIEINGDSNDEDDDCCVVSATPAPDIKPIIPKTENVPTSYPPVYAPSSTQQSFSSSNVLSSRMPSTPSTEKQHNFNWNAPDSKPAIDMLEKSADDIFESLLSSATKKENLSSLSDASEYISLDTLGPQHTCDICNTRFTDISLLEEHKRMTGHSKSLVTPSSSTTLLPYSQSSSILSSLLPVKQLAEQVGKLSGMNSGSGFTHQQNVMINIQAYPGAGGVMGPQPYNPYQSAPGQPMHPGYPPGPNNMYGAQSMPNQYPGQHYMGQQGFGQFQQPMSKPGYPGAHSPYSTASAPFSTTSPLQSMQQAYGQNAPLLNSQPPMGQMDPPSSAPGQYVPTSSPSGSMKPPLSTGVKIQNVQTFPPGQKFLLTGQTVVPGPDMAGQAPGQVVGGQMPAPNQIRMAGPALTRPRMPAIRNARPSIRPGIQVHGQIRGQKPGQRMPLKRPGGMVPGPGQKRRTDMLLPGKHDNEDCQVMAMQKQREGLPMIQSVQGAKDKLNLGSQISITKKTVNKEANAMANVLASRGISVKQKQKSRSPTPERPLPHIPNLGAGVSIKHTSKSSNFSIPEAKVGSGMLACKICKKMFMNYNSLQVHMSAAHPQNKIPMFKCDECPASYPKSLQLQHHKRVFHNVSGSNRELGLPVVDLSQEENLKRLSNLGIYSFIPLANREQGSGCFGIPVISVHNMQNGISTGLHALGADGLLSLGPLKPLPNT